MTISLDKLQSLFGERLEISSKLAQVERSIRLLVGEPDAQASEPVTKTARKQRAKTENPNDMQKLTDVQTSPDGACSEGSSVAPGAPSPWGGVSVVLLAAMAPATEYSKAELLQLALDSSSPDTDPEQLKTDVGNAVREMVADGHLVKTGEAKGTRYSRAK